MTRKIFGSICLVALVVMISALLLISGMVYDYFFTLQMDRLRDQTHLAARGTEQGGSSFLSLLNVEEYRITWIAADGSILFDNRLESGQMENHLEREEVREALREGMGESSRYSTSMNVQSLYSAQRLADGTVLRLSDNQPSRWALLDFVISPVTMVALAALALALFLAFRLSTKLVKPLNELDLDNPLKGKVYEEIRPLMEKLHSQQTQLRLQEKELKQKKREFVASTWNMTEGLVVMNQHGNILSINRFASRLLGLSPQCVGKDLLVFNHSQEVEELILSARGGERLEKTVSMAGAEYQFSASPVHSGGQVSGIVLLMLDITEKQKAEQLRREFSANVSHELKTPLQTISGCAELLSSGMVKQEDVPRFSRQIYSEAKRLISLVEDIIGLSHLDEGAADMQREQVELYSLAEEVIASLKATAATAEVALSLEGGPAEVYGIRQLLSGIVFNLCDNGIKYNRAGGQVLVRVRENKDTVTLSVTDTGIGIPDSEKERIFERFYRVDKSRSKAVGGTGLGLSIVKHSVRLHNASLEVDSRVGTGTTITVVFPKGANHHDL
ncbi:MAG: PAS domain S-box protein [Clostridiales bacterium]|nr:PAS domain S-box protein [Clostridiales bacterium]